MISRRRIYIMSVVLICLSTWGILGFTGWSRLRVLIADATVRNVKRAGTKSRPAGIVYPLDGTVFPPEIPPPTFIWNDAHPGVGSWYICVQLSNGQPILRAQCDKDKWTPEEGQWDVVKSQAGAQGLDVVINGSAKSGSDEFLSSLKVRISISQDPVGAPLFFREVNIPFIEAVKDPSKIKWRLGTISSRQPPPVVLEGLPVCGNCHSFSADGSVLGMDVDYANDKGSYAITSIDEETVLSRDKIISWSSYGTNDSAFTYGLLSRVSPDGRYVVSTVKDLSVFVPRKELAFSQLFFPIKGILVIYDRETKQFRSLPGADDSRYVQSNPVWSPDGSTIVFARSEAYQLKTNGSEKKILLTDDECREFLEEGKLFRYDLYSIPFNNGKGGKAEPLEGASRNGRSNYFPKYSPDGKWIVFCRANSYMLLQPDSELYIIPAAGGEARRLRCNTSLMNSWHSWSPNGKWLVFASKAEGPYTQLFLTHIGDDGYSTPPVLLSCMISPGHAANIPEFVNVKTESLRRITTDFLDNVNYGRAARRFAYEGDIDSAIRECRKALEYNHDDEKVQFGLALLLYQKGMLDEAEIHFTKTLQINSKYRPAMQCLASLREEREYIADIAENPSDDMAYLRMGNLYSRTGRTLDALDFYRKALDVNPESVAVLNSFAWQLATCSDDAVRNGETAVSLAENACRLSKHKVATLLDTLAAAYAENGQYKEAVSAVLEAIGSVRAGEYPSLKSLEKRLLLYKAGKPYRQ